MKLIGLIGGISWVSSAEYYKTINLYANERCGDFNFGRCLMHSVNFGEIKALQMGGNWEAIAAKYIGIARQLEQSGACCVLICANTMNKLAPQVQAAINIPVLHIADAVAEAIKAQGLTTVGLLGTRQTMEEDFYKAKLRAHGIATVIPNEDGRQYVHEVIHNELVKSVFSPETRKGYLDVIASMKAEGAQGAILGCTEIPLLIRQSDCDIPVFDTAAIHARAAVDFALS